MREQPVTDKITADDTPTQSQANHTPDRRLDHQSAKRAPEPLHAFVHSSISSRISFMSRSSNRSRSTDPTALKFAPIAIRPRPTTGLSTRPELCARSGGSVNSAEQEISRGSVRSATLGRSCERLAMSRTNLPARLKSVGKGGNGQIKGQKPPRTDNSLVKSPTTSDDPAMEPDNMPMPSGTA